MSIMNTIATYVGYYAIGAFILSLILKFIWDRIK